MTRYLRRSYPAKKISILEKREQELVHAIHAGHTTARLTVAAEKVRNAHLAVLKGKKYYIVDDGHLHFEELQRIDSEMADWLAETAREIIDKYKSVPPTQHYPPPPFASS